MDVCFESLAPHRCGFEFRQGLWFLAREKAKQLVFGRLVVLLRCPFLPRFIHGRALDFFHLQSFNSPCVLWRKLTDYFKAKLTSAFIL
jgi:hypothetical protein